MWFPSLMCPFRKSLKKGLAKAHGHIHFIAPQYDAEQSARWQKKLEALEAVMEQSARQLKDYERAKEADMP